MPSNPLKEGGGPAFPFNIDGQAHATLYGMSLADYFAAAALQGLIANSSPGDQPSAEYVVTCAYEIADLMIGERNRRAEQKNGGHDGAD
jgi:hypothetical protein